MHADQSMGRFVGYQLPGSEYFVCPEKHGLFLDAVGGKAASDGSAHPAFMFMAAHCGRGLSLKALMALLERPLDAGILLGHDDLTIDRPLVVGERVSVGGIISGADTKVGRSGIFDRITATIDVHAADGTRVGRSVETYIIPRAKA